MLHFQEVTKIFAAEILFSSVVVEQRVFSSREGILHSNKLAQKLPEIQFSLSWEEDTHPVIWRELVSELQGSTIIGC